MPKSPNPIRPRVKDAKAFERAMKDVYTDPMFRRLRARLAIAESANQAFRAMDAVVEEILAAPQYGVPTQEIQRNLDKMRGYHRKRVIDSFRAALGVNITIFLTEPVIAEFMKQKLIDNVDLIKTIPKRMHDSLKLRLQQELSEAPFDQQRLKILLNKEYKSTGYNLRRLTRDQNSKTINGLTEIRQTQLGIESYQWLTSQDERVRASHIANSGLEFSWSAPPETGHPGADVMCRCVAVAVITQAARGKFKDAGPHSILH